MLQTIITEENSSNFTTIASTFGEIVDYTTNRTETDGKLKTNYELLQGFCIYNMKLDKKANQICGSLCLTSLIENSSMVLEPAYMKYIWENIVYFIDKSVFYAKSEIINSLISLIFASENLFKPFATVTLYKILDFLTDGDWLKRKLALNVVYTLVIYCQEEILPLKAHIIEFLKVLKCDKIKEVREVCMQTLKLLNNSEDNEEKLSSEENDDENNYSIREIKDRKENIQIENSPRNKIIAETTKKDIQISPNFKNSQKKIENEISKIEKKSVNNSRMDFDNSNLNDLISGNDFMFEEKNENKKENCGKFAGLNKKAITNKNTVVQSKNELSSNNKNLDENQLKTQKSFPIKNNRDKSRDKLSTSISNNKKEISVNRKSDNSFVNSKMAIKRNPKYSIFKTQANRDFFTKTKNQDGEIEILFKEENKNNLSKKYFQEESIQQRENMAEKEKLFSRIENYQKINKNYVENEEINPEINSSNEIDCIEISENKKETKMIELLPNSSNKMVCT